MTPHGVWMGGKGTFCFVTRDSVLQANNDGQISREELREGCVVLNAKLQLEGPRAIEADGASATRSPHLLCVSAL